MGELLSVSDHQAETALLIGVQQGRVTRWEVQDSLDELNQLSCTAGAEVLDKIIVRQSSPHPATFIGKGKAAELGETVKARRITTVAFDDDLSPAQARNLEAIMGAKVLDRTQVILDIFAQHARTREGRLQIELAQLEYLLPRLRHMWTHLERQKGGIGLRGPGEKQLESDRRRIQTHLGRLRTDLDQVRARRAEQRRGRRRHGWALLTFVGYTNAGKSTLLNTLTGAQVKAHAQLFATLDPTTRRLRLPNHQMALITDTVGFIKKLPHHLVESFKATLEEVIEADLLVHVIDASHPRAEQQVEAVHEVLRELGAGEKPVVPVLNKMDLAGPNGPWRGLAAQAGSAVRVSALTGEGMEALQHALADALKHRSIHVHLRVPIGEAKLLAAVRQRGKVLTEEYEDGVVVMEATVPSEISAHCRRFLVAAGRD